MSEIYNNFLAKKELIRSKEDILLIDSVVSAIKNNGLFSDERYVEDKEKAGIKQLTFKDIVTSKEFYQLMPEIVQNIIVPEIEYAPMISNILFKEIPVP